MEDDTALLAAAKNGSAAALDRLFSRTAPRLLALIRHRMGPSLRSRLESRDILQGALLRAFNNMAQLEAESGRSFMAWLARIADSEIRDQADFHGRQRRDAAREVAADGISSMVASQIRSATSRLIIDEQMVRLERALDALEADHREVILLRKYEELRFAEIADRMGRSPDACRMLLARALTALTLRLREDRT